MLTRCNVLFEEHDQQQTSLIHSIFLFYRATSNNLYRAVLATSEMSACQTRVTKQRNLCQYSYTTWKNVYSSFPIRRMIGGDDPLYLKFWAKLTPFEQKRRFSIDIRSYSASAITPSEKNSINTNMKIYFCLHVFVFLCFILHSCCITVSTVGWTWWDWRLILWTYLPSVFWHCWLGHLTRKNPSPYDL